MAGQAGELIDAPTELGKLHFQTPQTLLDSVDSILQSVEPGIQA
ncbi:MAG TPA: hypothetical protein VF157_09710 [Chloroflexota bacterium]